MKIIEIVLPDVKYDLLNGMPMEELLACKTFDEIPDGKPNVRAAIGDAELEKLLGLMRAGAVVCFMRESEENA